MTGGYWRKRSIRRAFEKANAARDARRWSAAANHYRHFLSHHPDDFAIWVQLGHMLAESGEWDGADRAYRTADALRPDDADLALCRGHLARRMGDVDGALAHYRASHALDGNDHAAQGIDELAPPEPEAEPETQA